jgi:3,4-dihydroxy 2-butanone 4-phosphate synthase / GTP cyclohydrolase II
VKGPITEDQDVNVRVHSECLTGDAFGSMRCDCGDQLEFALKYIEKNGGVVLYLRAQEGRGIGLANKMKAYELQTEGLDTVEANHKLGFKADHRSYGIGAQILRNVGVGKMKLMTNNPGKINGLRGYGLEITGLIPVEIEANRENRSYLSTKKEKMGHSLKQDFNTNQR